MRSKTNYGCFFWPCSSALVSCFDLQLACESVICSIVMHMLATFFLGVHTANRPMLKVGGTVFKTVALRTQSHEIVCSLGFNTDTRCHLDSTLGGLCMKWNPSPYAMIEVDWLESWQFLMTEWSRLRYSRSPKKVIQTAFMRHPRRLCTGRFTTLCY